MNIVVSAAGRYHAFHLAEQLSRKGHLMKIFSTAPLRSDDNIPKDRYASTLAVNALDLFERACHLFGFRRITAILNLWKISLFDRYVSRMVCELRSLDVFVGWSGHCLHSLREAKRKGALAVVDHGAAHPTFFRKTLNEEYNKLKMASPLEGSTSQDKIYKRSLKEYDLADCVFIPSAFVERTFVDLGYPKRKLIRVPYGVDLDSFKQIRKRDDVFRIIWCGASRAPKGIHYLILAFCDLNLPNSELVLIGRVDSEIEDVLRAHAKENIKVLGPKFQKDLFKYYSQGTVFVHPSLQEGLSMVLIEAMACGLPLIATSNTGAEEIIREGKEGFIIPIRDVDALKNKIKYLYDHPELCKKMGIKAKQRAKKFTWDAYGDCIIAEYAKRVTSLSAAEETSWKMS